ncbi:MAG TPA: L-serine ammonia-lyase [Oscillospiraceae bacterium]|nr:L-serine ammonia-lyase [Oscillospiraceae bacterium]HPF55956.1 L-serine ammonia-lyase [Clostridiales bacterium]HPR75011.1 L-serine ammonia-lyase [Oscillospiraceae bacterium]
MNSLRHLYKIGRGPSSSHTMAPDKASRYFASEFPDADAYKCILYGSLAMTGKGHMTDLIIQNAFAPKPCEVIFDKKTTKLPHPNTFDLFAYQNGNEIGMRRVISIGGGSFHIVGEEAREPRQYYPENNFTEIIEACRKNELQIWEYVERIEGERVHNYLHEVWRVMQKAIDEGLATKGVLAGGLGVNRKANYLYNRRHENESPQTRENRIVCAYAFAVSEQNAGGGEVVTAPTCGASGVLPAVLKYMQQSNNFTDEDIIHALETAGVVGNVIKQNASISGAECGCQAEIGSACSMAAAAVAQLFGMSLDQIEYAAEVAMEHHLGLTCDPVAGLVQIPCIERNAVAAMRAINAFRIAEFLTETRKVSFDTVVKTMYETGKDLSKRYRETAEGGLAKYLKTKKRKM